MQKRTPDYDNVFKTMKSKHKRLFISVINDIFGKNYPIDAQIETLPSEGYLTESETVDGCGKIEEKISDFLMKIGDEIYLLESQSYDDGSMAIRIAEYAFIAARQFATWDIGHAVIPMPEFSVIYVKRTEKTPKTTAVTFTFPNGQAVTFEKRLFPYIPFYITRYEKDLTSKNSVEDAVKDLKYFRNEMFRLHERKELSDDELIDLMKFVNTIITHITNGNQNEERLVKIMGGTVLETESERLRREGRAEEIIKMGQEFGLDNAAILKRLQERIGLSFEQATAYLKQYGNLN